MWHHLECHHTSFYYIYSLFGYFFGNADEKKNRKQREKGNSTLVKATPVSSASNKLEIPSGGL